MDNFSRHVSYLNDVPTNRLLAWCNKDELRIQAVAKSISAFEHLPKEPNQEEKLRQVTLTEHALVLLDVAKDKLAIANEIYEDISPNSWSGSRADIMEERMTAFSALTNYATSEIRQFAESKMLILREAIGEARKFEAHRFAEREQRFE